jgi:hypothetical protein
MDPVLANLATTADRFGDQSVSKTAGAGQDAHHQEAQNPDARLLSTLAEPIRFTHDDLMKHGWQSISLGILTAAAAYPVLIIFGYVAIGSVVFFWDQFQADSAPWHDAVQMAMYAIIAAVGGAYVSVIWTGIVVLFTFWIAQLVVWSLRLRVNPIWFGAVYGGLIGFIAALPVTLEFSATASSGQDWSSLVMLALVPGIAIPLLQLGGAAGGRSAFDRAAYAVGVHRRLLAINWQPKVQRAALEAASRLATPAAAHFQFSIAHLLWIAAWVSLLLTVIRLSGVPHELIWPVLLGGLAYQAITLWLGALILPPFLAWRAARRKTRST